MSSPHAGSTSGKPALASAVHGQFFVETVRGRERLEYSEYGAGDAWVVLVPPLLVPRQIYARSARALAAAGLHVLLLDPLGHGRSDRPADPLAYSLTAFAGQVVALLDHVGANRAVIGGSSTGANVALEVAVRSPERVAGLILDGPPLDNAYGVHLALLGPVLGTARVAPLAIAGFQAGARLSRRALPASVVPSWLRVALHTLDRRPSCVAAALHGVLFDRWAPTAEERAAITAPTLVISRRRDPLHPLSDARLVASQIPGAVLERAWRGRQGTEGLDLVLTGFARECLRPPRRRRSQSPR